MRFISMTSLMKLEMKMWKDTVVSLTHTHFAEVERPAFEWQVIL